MMNNKSANKPKGLNNYPDPLWRRLTVYAFDPSLGRQLNNYMTINVPYEELLEGPIGRKLAVIDYDVSNDRYYEAVDLDHPAVTLRNGLEPSKSDPQFHQQMVYAVASETIRRFEFALGRSIKWRRRGSDNDGGKRHGRLRIFPHAFQQANAFYDPDLGAVLFGYFRDTSGAYGPLPGQTVFTCLSHDIIAHEVTHAILDGIREYFSEATSFDTPAFHEGFADIVALFQHFSMEDALKETIQRTGGLIYKPDLAPDAMPSGNPRIVSELSERTPWCNLGSSSARLWGCGSRCVRRLGRRPSAAIFRRSASRTVEAQSWLPLFLMLISLATLNAPSILCGSQERMEPSTLPAISIPT